MVLLRMDAAMGLMLRGAEAGDGQRSRSLPGQEQQRSGQHSGQLPAQAALWPPVRDSHHVPFRMFCNKNPFYFSDHQGAQCRHLPRPLLLPGRSRQRRMPSPLPPRWRGRRSLAAPSRNGRVQGFALVGSSSAPQRAPSTAPAPRIPPSLLQRSSYLGHGAAPGVSSTSVGSAAPAVPAQPLRQQKGKWPHADEQIKSRELLDFLFLTLFHSPVRDGCGGSIPSTAKPKGRGG